SERIIGIRRIEVFRQKLHSLRSIRNRFQRHTLPGLNPPAHARDPIFDRVDRSPWNRNFRKAPQVVRRRLRHDVAWRTIRVENRRQRQCPPLLLGLYQRGCRRHSRNPAHRAAQRFFNIHNYFFPAVVLLQNEKPRGSGATLQTDLFYLISLKAHPCEWIKLSWPL